MRLVLAFVCMASLAFGIFCFCYAETGLREIVGLFSFLISVNCFAGIGIMGQLEEVKHALNSVSVKQ